MSLRTRVTVLVAACVAGAVALVSLGAFVTVRNNLYSKLQEQLMAKTVAVAQAGKRVRALAVLLRTMRNPI